MARITKKQANNKFWSYWNKAIRDGRVVNFGCGHHCKAYNTVREAKEAVREAHNNEYPAFIVPSEKADLSRIID